MSNLNKTINKFSGNICFSAATDYGYIVVECDWRNQSISYDYATQSIADVCLWDSTSYLVAFSNQYIGRFSGGALNETYINTVAISNVDKIAVSKSAEIYILNRTTNVLYKYDGGIIWSVTLPDYSLRSEGNITWKEIDGTIIYNNNSNIHVIRDDTTFGTIINSLPIGGSGSISIVASNGFNPSYTYARARWVSDIEQSSSSSSMSSESSSSYSSLSSLSSESSSSDSSISSNSSSSNSSSSISSNSSSSNSSSSDSSSSISSESSPSSSSVSSSSVSSESSPSSSSNSSSSSSSSTDTIHVSGLSAGGEIAYNGAYNLVLGTTYRSYVFYKHISQDYFIWHNTAPGTAGFEIDRWILSAGNLSFPTFTPAGTDFNWYSPSDSLTVYLGSYNNDGTSGTAVVSQG